MWAAHTVATSTAVVAPNQRATPPTATGRVSVWTTL
jgi:hypothetical protein